MSSIGAVPAVILMVSAVFLISGMALSASETMTSEKAQTVVVLIVATSWIVCGGFMFAALSNVAIP